MFLHDYVDRCPRRCAASDVAAADSLTAEQYEDASITLGPVPAQLPVPWGATPREVAELHGHHKLAAEIARWEGPEPELRAPFIAPVFYDDSCGGAVRHSRLVGDDIDEGTDYEYGRAFHAVELSDEELRTVAAAAVDLVTKRPAAPL